MMIPRLMVIACVVAVTEARLCGQTVLFDFEDPKEISLWHDEKREALGADKRLEASVRFAASGEHSMQFFTPAWRPEDHGGRQKWPAFEGTPPIADWRGCDRLVFEMVNATPSPQRLMLFITDSKIATRSGLHHREIWWYICCGPRHPHANMFVEYPAIEGRLLMGAMTAKYRPDGFLYYQISIWNSEEGIDSGPFTDWNPRSWTTYHGDGSWTCVGPDGTPLPTIRLENFRDGLEDYAYALVLEQTVKAVEKDSEKRRQEAEWLTRARTLLSVPDEVVKSMTEYTLDSTLLRRYRNDLAAAISAAGIEPVTPW